MSKPIPRHYFSTIFCSEHNITHWPIHFAILSSLQSVSADPSNNSENGESLLEYLNKNYRWVRQLTAYNPHTETGESYCAVSMGWNEACEVAEAAGLEVIFYVSDNTLSVTYCDERRKPVYVDSFLKRYKV